MVSFFQIAPTTSTSAWYCAGGLSSSSGATHCTGATPAAAPTTPARSLLPLEVSDQRLLARTFPTRTPAHCGRSSFRCLTWPRDAVRHGQHGLGPVPGGVSPNSSSPVRPLSPPPPPPPLRRDAPPPHLIVPGARAVTAASRVARARALPRPARRARGHCRPPAASRTGPKHVNPPRAYAGQGLPTRASRLARGSAHATRPSKAGDSPRAPRCPRAHPGGPARAPLSTPLVTPSQHCRLSSSVAARTPPTALSARTRLTPRALAAGRTLLLPVPYLLCRSAGQGRRCCWDQQRL